MNTIIITKYENRKLYSRDAKKYVNLAELLELVQDGGSFRVETKTGEDVTREVESELIKHYVASKSVSSEKIRDFMRRGSL